MAYCCSWETMFYVFTCECRPTTMFYSCHLELSKIHTDVTVAASSSFHFVSGLHFVFF